MAEPDDLTPLLGPPEFYTRFAGRFFGKWRGLVKNNEDPRMLGRVRVFMPEVYGEYDLSPWAWPCQPMSGGIDAGFFAVPAVDSFVWVSFEEGAPDRPVYDGGFWLETDIGRPNDGSWVERYVDFQSNPKAVPMHAQGIPDGSDLDGGLKGIEGVPKSAFAGQYPHVRILKTPSGHFLEFDDTEGAERIQLHHKSGSHIEILPDGSVHIIAAGNLRTYGRKRTSYTEGNEEETVKGSSKKIVQGDMTVEVGGTYRIKYAKAVEAEMPTSTVTVDGGETKTVRGSLVQTVEGNLQMASGGDANIGAMNDANLTSGGHMFIVASNAQNLIDVSDVSLSLTGQNGRVLLQSTDRTGLLSKYGVEAASQGSPSQTITPTPVDTGPLVRLGNLSLPAVPSPTPLLQEPTVMGMQLHLYLQGLHAFLNAWLTDYLSHAHPWYSPSYTSVAQALILPPQLTALQTTWLTPAPPKQNPLILSDVVYTSKT